MQRKSVEKWIPKRKYPPTSCTSENKDIIKRREVTSIFNKCSLSNIEIPAERIVAFLKKQPQHYQPFVEDYFKAVGSAHPHKEIGEEASTDNPIVHVLVVNLAASLNRLKREDAEGEAELNEVLTKHVCAEIKKDFEDENLQHNIKGTLYIAFAKLAVEGIIPTDRFNLLSMVMVKKASTSQQCLIVYKMLRNGWCKYSPIVKQVLVEHMKKKVPEMNGRPRHCYREIIATL